MANRWEYYLPGGYWTNEQMSEGMQIQAENDAKQQMVLYTQGSFPLPKLDQVVTLNGKTLQVYEYGNTTTITGPSTAEEVQAWSRLVGRIAKTIPYVEAWITKPHLRRNDGTKYECACGATLAVPTHFGHDQFELNRHRDNEHRNGGCKLTIVRMPGKVMGFYGMGLGAVVAGVTLGESEIPTALSCHKPTSHAPDCECAVFAAYKPADRYLFTS